MVTDDSEAFLANLCHCERGDAESVMPREKCRQATGALSRNYN